VGTDESLPSRTRLGVVKTEKGQAKGLASGGEPRREIAGRGGFSDGVVVVENRVNEAFVIQCIGQLCGVVRDWAVAFEARLSPRTGNRDFANPIDSVTFRNA